MHKLLSSNLTMTYVTLNALRHNGEYYPLGKTLELDGQTADPLLVCGAIAPLAQAEETEKAAEPTPEPEPEPKAAVSKKPKAKGKKGQ